MTGITLYNVLPRSTMTLVDGWQRVCFFLRRFAPARCASFTSLWRPKRRRDCALSLYCPVLSYLYIQLESQTSSLLSEIQLSNAQCPVWGPHVQLSLLRHFSAHNHKRPQKYRIHSVNTEILLASTRSFHSIFVNFFCPTRLRNSCFLISICQSARICSLFGPKV